MADPHRLKLQTTAIDRRPLRKRAAAALRSRFPDLVRQYLSKLIHECPPTVQEVLSRHVIERNIWPSPDVLHICGGRILRCFDLILAHNQRVCVGTDRLGIETRRPGTDRSSSSACASSNQQSPSVILDHGWKNIGCGY